MGRRKRLTQKQLTVLDDLFNSDLDEQVVLDKHKVRRSTYDRWLEDKLFAEQFKQYVNGLKRQGELLLAKYSCLAAAKLVQLTESKNQETARKACLDIMSVPKVVDKETQASTEPQSNPEKQAQQLPPQTASKLLAALAEEKGGKF